MTRARGANKPDTNSFFEEWMNALMPHYMQAHTDVMNSPKNGKEEQQKWMAENRARFDAAPKD